MYKEMEVLDMLSMFSDVLFILAVIGFGFTGLYVLKEQIYYHKGKDYDDSMLLLCIFITLLSACGSYLFDTPDLAVFILFLLIAVLGCILIAVKLQPDTEGLKILYIAKNRFTKKRKLKNKYIDIQHLSHNTQSKLKHKLYPYFDAISELEKYTCCREELYSYGPYFDTLYDDLKNAIETTDHDYEEKVLLKKIKHSCKLLERISLSLGEIRENERVEQELLEEQQKMVELELEEQQKEVELESHKEDFSTTKELAKLLSVGST